MTFRSAVIDVEPEEILTLREIFMILLKEHIISKRNWKNKINDDNIIDKYKYEFKEHVKKKLKYEEDESIENMFQYVIDDLRKNSSKYNYFVLFKEILIADDFIPNDLQEKLIKEVNDYQNSIEIDYHPGSNDQVIDIVHPSLNFYVHGRSEISKKNASLFIESNSINHSKKYQWLPSDVTVKDGFCKFESYINNLDVNSNLNNTIEEIFNYFIPMFEECLALLKNKVKPIDIIQLNNEDYLFLDKNNLLKHDVNSKDLKKIKNIIKYDEIKDDLYDNYDLTYDDLLDSFIIKLPIFNIKYKIPKIKKYNLDNRKLQVIVKIGETLINKNDTFKGGNYHVEGMINERIVATGIYYFEIDNIKDSKLEFRQSVTDEDFNYNQYEYKHLEYIYGFENFNKFTQNLGSITALEGRMLVFPNIYQHKILPFDLIDANKVGIRKILVFFLVDPEVKIISTSMVKQQDFNDKYILREKLMEERKNYNKVNDEKFVREFFLCEH